VLRVRCHQPVSIDAKGRLTLPAKIRAAIDKLDPRPDALVVGPEQGFLSAWLPGHWEEKVEAPLNAADSFNPAVRAFGHAMAMFEDLEIDPQGRINLPRIMRQRAGLTKDCVVFVMFGRIEIWDRDRWDLRSAEVLSLPQPQGLSALLGKVAP
jgi:MraZ protein